MKSKTTWRHWVNKEGKPMSGRYYNFKTFKVYWAYRWAIAEELDRVGFGVQTKEDKAGINKRVYTNYAERYKC